MTTGLTNTDARVNITYGGNNGDLPDTVSFDATDGDIKQWVTEAVRTGGVPGLALDATADFTDFVVDRFTANENRPYNLIQLRPKTPFGGKRVRTCYFIPSDGFVKGLGFRVSIVREGEGGHHPTGAWPYDGKDHGKDMPDVVRPFFWGMDFRQSEHVATDMNTRLGLSEADVCDIMISSMSKGASETGGRPIPEHPVTGASVGQTVELGR